eukprot:gb/GFBE01074804.1/.p1 GENE.gb/GFBE01074804.1/~~gb/GFBE01074804.1/.p1  ORF type:complete len:401 (+),score=61.24 gb/GFBE01074804.1/:1-1203(+)
MAMASGPSLAKESHKPHTAIGKTSQDDEVGALIAPGGVFAQADDLSRLKPSTRPRPKISTYDEAYPGLIPDASVGGFKALQAPVLQGLRSVRPKGPELIAQEPNEQWRQYLQTSTVLNNASEEVLAQGARAQHRRQGVGREEQEKRWRRWMKQKQREANPEGAPSVVSGTTCTAVSSIPAGMRPAKCIGDSFPDGIRVPLFGEDVPQPVWTTLANAPWLEGKRQPPQLPMAETPWQYDSDPSHPLLQKRTLATVSARGPRREEVMVARTGGSGAQSARGSWLGTDVEVAAAGAAASPEARANKKSGVGRRSDEGCEGSEAAFGKAPPLRPRRAPASKASHEAPSAWFDDKVTLPLLAPSPRPLADAKDVLKAHSSGASPFGVYPQVLGKQQASSERRRLQ